MSQNTGRRDPSKAEKRKVEVKKDKCPQREESRSCHQIPSEYHLNDAMLCLLFNGCFTMAGRCGAVSVYQEGGVVRRGEVHPRRLEISRA